MSRGPHPRGREQPRRADLRIRDQPRPRPLEPRDGGRDPRSGRRRRLRFRLGHAARHRACGDAIYTNPFLIGFAYQKGLLPVGRGALERAFELNGRAVAANLRAFAWGRLAAHDLAAVEAAARPAMRESQPSGVADDLDGIVARRVAFLTDYQNARYAAALSRARRDRRRARERGRAGLDAARARRGALLLQAARGEGRVRGGAALHRRLVPAPARRRVRGRLPALRALRAAVHDPRDRLAHRAPRSRDRTHAQVAHPRALVPAGARGDGEAEVPARHAAEPVRAHRAPPPRAAADPRLRGHARHAARRAHQGQPRRRGRDRQPARARARLRGRARAPHRPGAREAGRAARGFRLHSGGAAA